MRKLYSVVLITLLSLCAKISYSQIPAGIYTVGPSTGLDYPTGGYNNFLSFDGVNGLINALNTNGITGTVVINVNPGYTETLTAGLSLGSATLNPTLSAFSTLTIQKGGVGANPVITANTGGTATPATTATPLDGIFALVGTDYVTIDGIDLAENGSNSAGSLMEFGYGLFKLNTNDGCQNVTIKNCTITLNRASVTAGANVAATGSCGIWSSNTLRGNNVAVVVASSAGANSNNKFYSNTIQNCNTGMYLIGYTTAALYDQSNDVGGSSSATGNNIINYGGGGAGAAVAVSISGQAGFNISYNYINNNNGSGINHTNLLRGILTANSTSVNGTINRNTITLTSAAATQASTGIENGAGATSASNTINITSNVISITNNSASIAATATGISHTASATTVNINNNKISGITLGNSNTTSAIAGINITNTAANLSVSNDTVINLSSGVATTSGAISGITISASPTTTLSITNNLVNTFTCTSTSYSNNMRGIVSQGSPAGTCIQTIQYNTVYGLSASGTNNTCTVNGITYIGGPSSVTDISYNTVYTFSYGGVANATPTLGVCAGISQQAGATTTIYKNKIYDISGTNAGAPAVCGLQLSGGTTVNVSNNIIGDIKAASATTANAAMGIYLSSVGVSTFNIYHNTVYLSGTSTSATFGSSAFSFTPASASSTTATVINNIFVNNGTPKGANYCVAYRRNSFSGTYSASSDNNLFFSNAGTGYYDGVATSNVLPFIAGTDANSIITENPNFLSTVGSNASFLHISSAVSTFIESGGKTGTGINDDFDNESRPGPTSSNGGGTGPDIGADEFDGIPKSMVISSLIANPAVGQCSAVAHNVTAVVVPPFSGTVASVVVNWSVNGVAQAPINLVNSSGNNWTGAIPAASPTNGVVTWSITATDGSANTKSYTGTSYQDDYLNGVTATFTPASPTVCAGSSSPVSVTLQGPGNATIGAGASNSAASGGGNAFVSPYYHSSVGGIKGQYIFLASELTAAGLKAGNINSITFQVVNGGTTYQNFQVTLSHTAAATQSAGNFAASSGGLVTTNVGSVTPSVGLNTYYLTTAFNWNGSSNIYVQVCWSNVNTGGPTATVKWDNPGFTSTAYYWANSTAAATICGNAAYTNVINARPKIIFNGQISNLNSVFTGGFNWAPAPSTGQGTSSVTVAPGSNQTYTVIATDANSCTVSGNVNVAVNALPTAPTANNGSRCPGIPSNTTVSGGGPQYIWYSAASGGSVLQAASALNYYNTSIASTTTFYVTSYNPGTGCESSPRVPVTATIITPDPVAPTSNAVNNIACVGAAIQLNSNQVGSTNTYTSFSWTASPVPNSGIGSFTNLSTGGAANDTISVTPTLAGSYQYTVTATDGTCTVNGSITVTAANPPTINSVTTSNNTVCPGTQVSLGCTYTTVGVTVFSESFNSGVGAWTTVNNSVLGTPANSAWTSRPDGYVYNGTWHSCDNSPFMLSNSDAQGNATGVLTDTYLTSPTFDLSPYTASQISFCEFYRLWSPAWNGGAEIFVDVSPNGGTTWYNVYRDSLTRGNFASFFTKQINMIPSQVGGSFTNNMKMRFHYYTVFGWFWGVDNVVVTGSTSSFSWTSSLASVGMPSTQQNPTGVGPASTTTYTVAVTSNGCTTTGNVTVNVLAGPSAPSVGANPVQCGRHIPGTTIISNSGTPPANVMFDWYDAASGGNLMQSGTTNVGVNTYLGYVNSTTTFYVAENNGTCPGPRTPVTITVNPAPALTITPGTTITNCLGTAIPLNASSASSYSYSWAASPLAGSGMAGTVNAASNPVTPTAIGTYAYTVTAIGTGGNTGCDNTATVNVTVNPVPTAPTMSPTSISLCPGQVAALNSTSTSTNTCAFGTQSTLNTASTGSAGYPGPYTVWYAGQRMQMLIKASELIACGYVAGSNFSSIEFPVVFMGANWGVTTFGCISYSISMGYAVAPNNAGTITAFQSGLTQVYSNASYTPVIGWNSHPFSANWPGGAGWDGVTDVVVEVTFSNGASGYVGQTADLVQSYSSPTAFQSTIVYRRDAQTPATVAAATGVTFFYNRRPDYRLGGTSLFPVSWSPMSGLYTDAAINNAYTGGSYTTIYAAPSSNTVYTSTATNSYGCTTNSPTATVNISYAANPNTNQLAGVMAAARTSNQNNLANSPNLFDNSNCKLISTLASSGGNPASGQVMARVKIESYSVPGSVTPTFSLEPYVARHFDIELITNAADASTRTGTVTLYVLDAEMQAYNNYVAANLPLYRRLPSVNVGGTVANPNSPNVSVTHYMTNSSNGSSNAGTYSLLYPADAEEIFPTFVGGSVNYYANANYPAGAGFGGGVWAITFPVTNLAGGAFFIHANRFDAILPVQWINVKAFRNNDLNTVEWTVTDQNMLQYEVQRSTDGSNFESIGTVPSHGSSNVNYTYRLNDTRPVTGINYYRIKGTSNDGKTGYSRVVVVIVDGRGIAISSLFPNPATTVVNYEVVSGINTRATIQVTDITGKVISTTTERFIKGTNTLHTDISNLPQGQYRLQILTDDGFKDIKPFVKL